VVWNASAARAVQTWGLPDEVFVEMRLRVNVLAENPAAHLVRIEAPFDGMAFAFEFIDPTNRLIVHSFLFQVVYSQDEATLFVARVAHGQRYG
jgi:hypothetical protein